MGKYGEAARLAAGLLRRGEQQLTPEEAWSRAVALVFPNSPSAQAKNCPRAAFLTLCELGAVNGVARGAYTRSERNKAYVTRALVAVREDPTLVGQQARLWHTATDGVAVKPNSQIDVLAALWVEGLVR